MSEIEYREFKKNLIEDKEEFERSCRNPSGCAVFGVMNEGGKAFSGSMVMEGISIMHERSNGLGGGFAAYGIYPQFKEDWVFHLFYDDIISKKQTEDIIAKDFNILFSEEIPTSKVSSIKKSPIIYRYFLKIKNNSRFNEVDISKRSSSNLNLKRILKQREETFIVEFVMKINSQIKGAYIISSGKNMGIFKGVGYPEDIGEFFKIDEYKGYLWISHGRFPTNSVVWWGGSHPFGLLNWSVVHNGEISSYGTNKRYVSGFGYECTLSTDTEVITYLFDLLVRKLGVNLEIIHMILAAPLWEEIELMDEDMRELLKALRISYSSALLNGPFSIIVGNNNYMYALNDRIKLRPMVAAKKGDYLFVSSEEAAIRGVCISPDILWHPRGGEPVIGLINKKGSNAVVSSKNKSKILDRI
jgi:glutamate synthase domain-containing protein 1